MAERLELDNVIINLQDLIKAPTILILLSTGTTKGRGRVIGQKIGILLVYVYKCE